MLKQVSQATTRQLKSASVSLSFPTPVIRRYAAQTAAPAAALSSDTTPVHHAMVRGVSRISNLVFTQGSGTVVTTAGGHEYLDFTCGIGVTNTGHCHKDVVKAIQNQAELFIHCQQNIGFHQPMLDLMDELGSVLPSELNSFFFWNSGAEAVEGSLKMARLATGRPNVICFQGGFHGRTFGTMAITSSKNVYKTGFGPFLGGVYVTPFPYARQMGLPATTSQQDLEDMCILALQTMFKQQTAPEETAAIILESVLGEGGYLPVSASFLRRIRDICDETGILLIVDEVQAGFGRTGKWFGFQHTDVVPDMVVMAKGIASGLPLSCVAIREQFTTKQAPGSMGGTYSANIIACAAALATMNVIRNEKLLDNAVARGNQLRQGLERINKRLNVFTDIRGPGLMIGAELNTKAHPRLTAGNLVEQTQRERLLVLSAGCYDVMRVIPPLTVTSGEIDDGVSRFERAIEALL